MTIKTQLKNLISQVDKLESRLQKIGEQIWDHGSKAAKIGRSIDDNPWKDNSNEFYMWRAGWVCENITNQRRNKAQPKHCAPQSK